MRLFDLRAAREDNDTKSRSWLENANQNEQAARHDAHTASHPRESVNRRRLQTVYRVVPHCRNGDYANGHDFRKAGERRHSGIFRKKMRNRTRLEFTDAQIFIGLNDELLIVSQSLNKLAAQSCALERRIA